jgi:hypothetical protein
LKLYVVESDHKLRRPVVTLCVAFAANGTGIVGVVFCFHMLLVEVSTREPSVFRKKIERLEKEVVDLEGARAIGLLLSSIVASERLVECGGKAEAAGPYAAGRGTVQVDKT